MGKKNSRYRLKKRPADIQPASPSEEAATQKPIMKGQLHNDNSDAANRKKRKSEAPSDDREVDALDRDDTQSKNEIHKKIKQQSKDELHSSRPKTVLRKPSSLEEIKKCTSVVDSAKPHRKRFKKFHSKFVKCTYIPRSVCAASKAEYMNSKRLPESIHKLAAGGSDSSER